MTPREILIAARAKIYHPKHWCQRAYARNAAEIDTSALDREAVMWCAEGALSLAGCDVPNRFRSGEFLYTAAQEMGFDDVAYLNDNTDHPTVLRMFDRAIELAGEAE